jgi:hydroxypyruvate isomerase
MNASRQEDVAARVSRRGWLQGAAGVVAAAGVGFSTGRVLAGAASKGPVVTKGRIKQSVCEWCFTGDCSFRPMTLDELARHAAAMGLRSVELVAPKNWPILKKHGLACAITSSHSFVKGWNHKENWPECKEKIEGAVDATAAAGFPTVITFSGFRQGMPDDVGLENTVAGLKTVVGYAEKKKVTLCLEVLNSRVAAEMKGHPDYMGDSVEWCVEVCKRIGSPRMKILFDVYHVQIMQGDIITRIKKYHEYVGHYHTAGVPGRNEFDDSQEINYRPIIKAIAETKYQGYVGHEFIPTRDPLQGLREAAAMCDV